MQCAQQMTEPCQCQGHLPRVSMLVKLNFLHMHAEYVKFSSDGCRDLNVLHANILCVIVLWLFEG